MSTTNHLIASVLEDVETVHNISQGIRHAIRANTKHPQSAFNQYLPDLSDFLYALGRHEQFLLQNSDNPDRYQEIGE